MKKIEWKSLGMGQFFGYVGNAMVMMIVTADGPLYYVLAVPSIQYASESALVRYLNKKRERHNENNR